MRALTALVSPIVAVVMYLLQNSNEIDARDILIELTDICEQEPSLFRPNFQDHARMLIQARPQQLVPTVLHHTPPVHRFVCWPGVERVATEQSKPPAIRCSAGCLAAGGRKQRRQ